MTQAPPPDLAAFFVDAAPRLGLSRPAGQCFGVIWRAEMAPDADALVAITGLSRSAVSTALKELREAGLVLAMRILGTRREGFTAPTDPWALLRLSFARQLHRDIAPMRDRLRQKLANGGDTGAADLAKMLEAVAAWLSKLADAPPEVLAAQIGTDKAESHIKKKKKKG
ncbi:MAG: ArsR family transcriptional regulator [Phaeovulum sp.]|uniref:GbsR/MarR family transcriptional regulator n=1 Tax=Phaeovulum sp. TaxID=2934796 RepID=UPI002730CD56|nr:ArsR family transcriptional regulator [Phaeovulum sp.]MDP2061928.1 ArsR family transcriptional regulator [Phaeovulum sp.]